MKIISKNVRLNEEFIPVMVLTIEFPLALGSDAQSCDSGAFYSQLEDAILEFDKAAECSLTPKT